MASGKQLSFQYGEVSPSLRYRSDAVSYAQGLGKLRNMYVRRAGGVSNRPGFEFVRIGTTQYNIPAKGGNAGVKATTYWSSTEEKWVTIEYTGTSITDYGFFRDGVAVPLSSGATPQSPAHPVRFTPIDDGVIVAPSIKAEWFALPGQFNNCILAIRESETGQVDAHVGEKNLGGLSFSVNPAGSSATAAPYLPVTYLFTITLKNGREELLGTMCSIGYNPGVATGTGPFFPHASLSNRIKLTLGSIPDGLRHVSLYRSAGAVTELANTTPGDPLYFLNLFKTGNKTYRLAGRNTFLNTGNPAADAVFVFEDFGADDPSITAPIDASFLGPFYSGLKAIAAVYHQQRLILSMEPELGKFLPGDIVASKLGAPDQFRSPIIFSNTGAFRFSVPINDGTTVVAWLSMERLIALTSSAVWVLRGGDQGILTPTAINPLRLSDEGCSATVEPKMSGKRGYFINASHTKLMAITFGQDATADIAEVSLFAEHMLDASEITQLEVLSGSEDTIYLLRRDGSLVRATTSDLGTVGFSVVEVDGQIESIYKGKAKKKFLPNTVGQATGGIYYDVLMAYIIRGGSRSLYRLNVRQDLEEEGFNYADFSSFFGWRLSEYGEFGYLRNAESSMSVYYDFDPGMYINIKSTVTTWEAGETVKIRTTAPLVAPQGLANWAIHFYYEDENGKTQTLQYNVDYDSEVAVVDGIYVWEISGFFSSDVPESLQNVAGNADLSTYEKTRRLTRWCPAINWIDSYMCPGPFVASGITGAYVGPLSVFADGEVLSSPLNPNKAANNIEISYNDTWGAFGIDLPGYYAYGVAGLPYTAEMETLDLEVSDARTLTDAKKLINAVGVGLMETRGGFYGIPDQELSNMEELITREDGDLGASDGNFNGQKVVSIPTEWTGPGRVSIKHVDPTPMSVLAIYPKGISGE